jgi:hypothetical protein
MVPEPLSITTGWLVRTSSNSVDMDVERWRVRGPNGRVEPRGSGEKHNGRSCDTLCFMPTHHRPFLLASLLLVLSTVLPALANISRWEVTNFCKCICFESNYTILQLEIPDNPSKPCLSCTKQWCLNQNLPMCAGATLGDPNPDTGTGKEGDVESRCFQRDSPRDQLVVVIFLLTVFGLLLGVGIKGKMTQAGIQPNIDWDSGRRWWEVRATIFLIFITFTCVPQEWQPRRQFEELRMTRFPNGRTRRTDDMHELRNGEYTAVFETPPSP